MYIIILITTEYSYKITTNNIKQFVASGVKKYFASTAGYDFNKASSGIVSSKNVKRLVV